ncbi:MAG: DUF881 domain-containing protein [Firmicutes bacterium]|nr:DUF881 domain-containing protein [Bacillota bacterium]
MKNVLYLSALALLLGVMIIIAARTNMAQLAQIDNNNQELIDYIEKQEAESAELEQKIVNIRQNIENIHKESAESESMLNILNDSLAKINLVAGYTPVSGPGIVVTLDDNSAGAELAKKNNPVTYNAENFIVHDKDLLYLVKALTNAEAISINGIRIIDSSSIRCVGTVIMVNSTRIAPPYEISFIGNGDALMEQLQASGRYIALVYKEIPINAVKADNIVIPAYTGTYSTNYMQVYRENRTTETE